MQRKTLFVLLILLGLVGVAITVTLLSTIRSRSPFSGNNARALITAQVALGPRYVGAEGHTRVQEFLQKELAASFADVKLQRWTHTADDGRNMPLVNIVARYHPEREDRIILATHYDTNPHPQTPGANNGASGVAVLLELARVMAMETSQKRLLTPFPIGVDFVFFDGEEGEDGVKKDTWRPLGSQYFASHLEELYAAKKPRQGIVIDMVCEEGAQINREPTSLRDAPDVSTAFWRVARNVAPAVFGKRERTGILDDHTALNAADIPSILLIDFEYPWIYSLDDTPDKCSAQSVQSVGDALLAYLQSL